MTKRTIAGALLALSLGLPAAAQAADPAPAAAAPPTSAPAAKPGPSDRAQIAVLEKAFAAAVESKDTAKVMAVYAKKGLYVFDVVPPRAYGSWDAYKKDWEELFAAAMGPIKFEISDLSITTDGAMAYSHSIQGLHYAGKAGQVDTVVRVTDVYRKDAGKWRIVHEHVSVPVDLETGKPDLLSKP
jgi:uncharacterized protein (TIGR02246 family)